MRADARDGAKLNVTATSLRGQPKTSICCFRQGVNQPAGSPLGSGQAPATAAIHDRRRNSALVG